MTSRCSLDNRINARRTSSLRSFSCNASSGSLAGSAMVASIFSSNSAPSIRRRRADSALWRAIDSNHVETEERHWEVTRLTPHIEKNLAQEVLGKRLIADEAKE